MTQTVRPTATQSLVAIVGLLVVVELASGVLQGFYTPIFTQIARHLDITDADVNWFEAAQLIVSALVVPVLARAGDLIGHRKVLLISTAVTAIGSWAVAFAPSFGTFLVAWAIQGFYVVWLPLEVAIIHRRTAGSGRQSLLTRRAAAILVVALELGVIIAALSSGMLVDVVSMTTLLSIPAIIVTLALVAIWFGVREVPAAGTGRIDWGGFAWVTLAISVLMGGLIAVRLMGPTSLLAWAIALGGLALFVPFARFELRHADPLIDLRVMAAPAQWPVQLTAFFFGMSVLGAQIPLSTYAQTDPAEVGYGLGQSPAFVSTLIAIYVVSLVIGAGLLPLAARLLGPRGALIAATGLVALGYGLWIPFHLSTTIAMLNMGIAGVGSGALVAALPAAAATAAPAERTGFVTGMTNTTKTIGGAIASAIFAIALSSTGGLDAGASQAPLSGYLTVWAVCSLSALAAAIGLLLVPKGSFADPEELPGVPDPAGVAGTPT